MEAAGFEGVYDATRVAKLLNLMCTPYVDIDDPNPEPDDGDIRPPKGKRKHKHKKKSKKAKSSRNVARDIPDAQFGDTMV